VRVYRPPGIRPAHTPRADVVATGFRSSSPDRREYRVSVLSGRVVSAYLKRPPETSGSPLLAEDLPVTLRCAAVAHVERRARIEYPRVPNSRALSSPRAPANVSSGLANSTSMSPAPPITVSHPAHGRAPAIQPVQRSMSWSASSGTGRSRQMSATVIWPPGRNTRKIWR
jgi:hypothetical protein